MSSPVALGSRYERYALIYDHDRSRLGHEALGLVERGIDALYASDPDEAHLLALQESGRIGALVVQGSLAVDELDTLLERIGPQLWAGPASVVVVGPPTDRGALRALQDRSLSWALREPYDAAEFRFVVSAALATDDKLEPRSGLRVPVSLPIGLTADGAARAGVVRNLSVGGAYVALAPPIAPGVAIELSLGIGDHRIATGATVVYAQSDDVSGRAVQEPGMGIAFRGLGSSDHGVLEGFIRERTQSFRL